VGKELGARYVIEGSLRQARTRLRIAVQLVDASFGAPFAPHSGQNMTLKSIWLGLWLFLTQNLVRILHG
jgi:TolB-like protein